MDNRLAALVAQIPTTPIGDPDEACAVAEALLDGHRGIREYFMRQIIAAMMIDFINMLPDELLVEIFKYLSTAPSLNTLALVCKRFYRIAQDNCFWKPIYEQQSYSYITKEPLDLSWNGAFYNAITHPFDLFTGNWIVWDMGAGITGLRSKLKEDLILIVSSKKTFCNPVIGTLKDGYRLAYRGFLYENVKDRYENNIGRKSFDVYFFGYSQHHNCYLLARRTGIEGEKTKGQTHKSCRKFLRALHKKFPFERWIFQQVLSIYKKR